MIIPSLAEINSLHNKYAPNKKALDNVWEHCKIVQRIASQVASNRQNVHISLVNAGALLHDIGVYRLYIDGSINEPMYITHGLLGYELLREEGFDEAICRFALLHTGVGITKQDIEKNHLPLPPEDYVAETEEEKIVMFADKFHSKTIPPVFNSANWYVNHLMTRFGETKVRYFEELLSKFGEPKLTNLASEYNLEIR